MSSAMVNFFPPQSKVIIFCVLFFTLLAPVMAQVNKGNHNHTVEDYEQLIKKLRYDNPDSALLVTKEALTFFKSIKDRKSEGQILLQFGMIKDNSGDFNESKKAYDTALILFSAAKDNQGVVSAIVRLGVVELRNGVFDIAIQKFLEALRLAERDHYTYGILEGNYNISWAYLEQGEYNQSLSYLKTAENIHDTIPFSSLYLNILNHYGRIYTNLNDLEKARKYLEKGLKLSRAVEYQGLNVTITNNLATVYAKLGMRAQAITIQKEALAKSRKIGNYLRELQVLGGLANSYGKDDPKNAIFYLQQAVELARNKNAAKIELRYLEMLAPAFENAGDFRSAYATKQREYVLADSVFYKAVQQKIASLEAQHELEKSKAKIKELNVLSENRKLALEKSALVRNVAFAGSLLLLVILVLVFRQSNMRRRSGLEISKKNEVLEQLLTEKEWLLKEVHHRVKNNLQMIVSLLESQAHFLKDESLLAIQKSQNRIFAMSLVHQKLYQTDNLASIEMSTYLPELIRYLQDSFDPNRKIKFSLTVDEIVLDVSQALPIGLILNEAVTNSLKYAFPDNRFGNEITVQMKWNKNEKVEVYLIIADNGVGLPDDFEQRKNGHLGFRLIEGLINKLHATPVITTRLGTVVELTFKAIKTFSREWNLPETAEEIEY